MAERLEGATLSVNLEMSRIQIRYLIMVKRYQIMQFWIKNEVSDVLYSDAIKISAIYLKISSISQRIKTQMQWIASRQ